MPAARVAVSLKPTDQQGESGRTGCTPPSPDANRPKPLAASKSPSRRSCGRTAGVAPPCGSGCGGQSLSVYGARTCGRCRIAVLHDRRAGRHARNVTSAAPNRSARGNETIIVMSFAPASIGETAWSESAGSCCSCRGAGVARLAVRLADRTARVRPDRISSRLQDPIVGRMHLSELARPSTKYHQQWRDGVLKNYHYLLATPQQQNRSDEIELFKRPCRGRNETGDTRLPAGRKTLRGDPRGGQVGNATQEKTDEREKWATDRRSVMWSEKPAPTHQTRSRAWHTCHALVTALLIMTGVDYPVSDR